MPCTAFAVGLGQVPPPRYRFEQQSLFTAGTGNALVPVLIMRIKGVRTSLLFPHNLPEELARGQNGCVVQETDFINRTGGKTRNLVSGEVV